MRAIDLAVFVILIEMSIGFLGVIGAGNVNTLADGTQTPQVQQMVYEQGGDYGVGGRWQQRGSTVALANTTQPSVLDYVRFGIDWISGGFFMLLQIMAAFFAISWVLYTKFKIPMEICVFIQGIVWLIYSWALIQWKSGRGGAQFE